MTSGSSHRLDGLEPDNLLAFLALLGLLRALEIADQECPEVDRLVPRVGWDIDRAPLRPEVVVKRNVTRDALMDDTARGVAMLAKAADFAGRRDLNYSRVECRKLLVESAKAACRKGRDRVDLLAALMSDAAVKEEEGEPVDPTPLCLLFGQGHQHFLQRLADVPRQLSPPTRGRGRAAVSLGAGECLAEALFQPWHRKDPTSAFRWDPEEAVRYSLMAGDPTDAAYKPGTQHGANRLAAVGLAALTTVPQARAGRTRLAILGGAYGADGLSMAWPIWREPATLSAIRALLAHPKLRSPGALTHLGVDQVYVAQRISVGKYMNFSRARPLPRDWSDAAPR